MSFGRLNSFYVAQWHEPIVTMLPDAHIDPELATFFAPLLKSR
ncbi:hypothetical protein [Microbacterium phyllosphaerae]|nr:hypothetical protein [Microbacterium phyllosphaerae]